MRIYLDDKLRKKVIGNLDKWLKIFETGCRKIRAHHLATLVGQMGFCSNIMCGIRLFFRPFYDLFSAYGVPLEWGKKNKRFDPAMRVSDIHISNLQYVRDWLVGNPFMKVYFSARHNEGFIISPELFERKYLLDDLGSDAYIHVSSDASGTGGGVIINGGETIHFPWDEDLAYLHKEAGSKKSSSNKREFFTICMFVRHMKNTCKNKIVVLHTDNLVSKHYCNFFVGRKDDLNILAKELFFNLASVNSIMIAAHVPGIANIGADIISRYSANFLGVDKCPHRKLKFFTWNNFQKDLEITFTWDLFSADDGHNSLCDKWSSPLRNAFEVDFSKHLKHVFWGFPPNFLVFGFLKFLARYVMRLEMEKRPLIIFLVRKNHNKFKYLLDKFFFVTHIRTGGDHFEVFDEELEGRIRLRNRKYKYGAWKKTDKAESPYFVFSTVPTEIIQSLAWSRIKK